jgi:hypothetical protein
MSSRQRCVAVLVAALAAQLVGADPPTEEARTDVKLTTVEGEVLEIRELPGEGDVSLVAVALRRDGEQEPLTVLLAPRPALEEIGFVVEVGDRLKVRIFADDGSPARAQRVLNASRGSLARLRTLRHTPLWSASGSWRGPGTRDRPGPGPGGRPEGGPPGHGHGRGA